MIFMSEVGAIVYGVCTISTCITRAVLFCYLSIGVKELLTTCSIGTLWDWPLAMVLMY